MAAGSALFWVLIVVGAAMVVAAVVLYVRRRRDHHATPGTGRGRDDEKAEFFEVVEKPITAIRKVVRHLEAADAIVYADLHTGEVHAHHGLVDDDSGGAALSKTRMFLSIVGVFEIYEEKDESDADYLRLRVPYPDGGAYVRVKFPRSGLRQNDVLPHGNTSFGGRVLGKVESRDEEDRVLKMWAPAIFQ